MSFVSAQEQVVQCRHWESDGGRGCCWWMQQGPCLGICIYWECHCQLCMAWCSKYDDAWYLQMPDVLYMQPWSFLSPFCLCWIAMHLLHPAPYIDASCARVTACVAHFCGTFTYVCTWAAGATYVHACKIDVMLHPVHMMLLVLHTGLWPSSLYMLYMISSCSGSWWWHYW